MPIPAHHRPALVLALLSSAALWSACPGPQSSLELTPEVPDWQEGTAPKAFRAHIRDREGRPITARIFYKRRAVNADTTWEGTASRISEGSEVFEFVLPPEHRPETFLRTQTVDYRWEATAEGDNAPADLVDVWNTFQVGCGDDAPAWWMAEQDRWVSSLDGLDVAELALRGYVPSHGPVAFRGLGLTFFKALPQFGEPDLIFYEPSVGDMRLAGWGYAAEFDVARWPTRGCIPFESWFVHQQGWHLPNGAFIPVPDGVMTPPAPGSVWHPRLWDVHLWRRDGETPLISVYDDTLLPDAPTVPDGTFFSVPWALP